MHVREYIFIYLFICVRWTHDEATNKHVVDVVFIKLIYFSLSTKVQSPIIYYFLLLSMSYLFLLATSWIFQLFLWFFSENYRI